MDAAITMNPDASPETLARIACLAEDIGYSTCYIADQGFSRDVYVTLTMLAAATRRLRLGPGITHPYTRHPVTTAIAVAALDEISEGRAFLGLGAGGTRTLGRLQIMPAQPLRACREAIEIARLLWRGGKVNYAGNFFQLQEAQVTFPCRPDIEIHWAARGPRMLALGGELADVVMLHRIPFFDLGRAVANIRQGAKKEGRPVQIRLSLSLVYDQASREHSRMKAAYTLIDSQEDVRNKLGISPALTDRLRSVVSTQGPWAAAPLISDRVLSHFIVEGAPEDCAAQIRALGREYAIDRFTIEVALPGDPEQLLRRAADIVGRV